MDQARDIIAAQLRPRHGVDRAYDLADMIIAALAEGQFDIAPFKLIDRLLERT